MRDMHVAIGSKEASIHIAMHIRRHHRVVESCVKDHSLACSIWH